MESKPANTENQPSRSTLDHSANARLLSRLEAILFASPTPATIEQLAEALQAQPAAVKAGLVQLEADYTHRGLRLQVHQGKAQLTSAPEHAADIQRFLRLDSRSRLSRAALEVLAIVSYRQPVTRPQVDSIRGVNSDTALKTLLRHGLVEEAGRSQGAGRPILYGTGTEFLQHFGLGSLDELPELEGGKND
jgi:segregation and condensation protein B